MAGFDFGALGRVLTGSGRNALPLPLEPGETEVRRVVASRQPGTMRSVGGDLVLTSLRLAFTPLNVKDVSSVLVSGLKAAGLNERLVALATRAESAVGDVSERDLAGQDERAITVAAVRVGTAPRLLKPPTLVVTYSDGTSDEFGVLAARTSPNISTAGAVARDAMASAILAAIR